MVTGPRSPPGKKIVALSKGIYQSLQARFLSALLQEAIHIGPPGIAENVGVRIRPKGGNELNAFNLFRLGVVSQVIDRVIRGADHPGSGSL
jgi:hypothetical protein